MLFGDIVRIEQYRTKEQVAILYRIVRDRGVEIMQTLARRGDRMDAVLVVSRKEYRECKEAGIERVCGLKITPAYNDRGYRGK